MRGFHEHELKYVAWQNRATRFYVAARLCYLRRLYAPAVYCGVIALEVLVKATLVYHDRSFKSTHFRHSIAKLERALHNKVPASRTLILPSYFWHEDRYLTVTRYPTDGKGVGIPASFLPDLDAAFVSLLRLTPFQFNSELKHILAGTGHAGRWALTRSNSQSRALRRFLNVRASPRRAPGA